MHSTLAPPSVSPPIQDNGRGGLKPAALPCPSCLSHQIEKDSRIAETNPRTVEVASAPSRSRNATKHANVSESTSSSLPHSVSNTGTGQTRVVPTESSNRSTDVAGSSCVHPNTRWRPEEANEGNAKPNNQQRSQPTTQPGQHPSTAVGTPSMYNRKKRTTRSKGKNPIQGKTRHATFVLANSFVFRRLRVFKQWSRCHGERLATGAIAAATLLGASLNLWCLTPRLM